MGEPGDDYWGRLCHTMASRCLECSSLGMRGDPMGVLRVSSSSHQFYESDSTHDSPRPSLNIPGLGLDCEPGAVPGSGSASAPPRDAAAEVVAHLQNLDHQQQQQERQECLQRSGCENFLRRWLFRIVELAKCQQVATDPMLFPRIALMAMLALMVTVLTVSAWYVAAGQIRKSVAPLVSSLRTGAAIEVEKPLGNSLNYTGASVSLVSNLLSTSNITSSSPQLRSLLWTGYFMRPGGDSVGFFSDRGDFMSYGKNPGTGLLSLITSSNWENFTCQSSVWFFEQVDPGTGKQLGPPQKGNCLFRTANPSLYESLFNDTSGQTFSDLISDSSGRLFLVLLRVVRAAAAGDSSGVAFVRRSVNEMMRLVDAFQQEMFVMTTDGKLVGVHGHDYVLPFTGAELRIPLATESNNSLVSTVASLLRRTNASLGSSSYSFDNVLIAGRHYHVNTVPLLQYRTGLVAVLIISVKSLELGLDRRLHAMGMIFTGIAISVAIVGCCMVVMLTKGVSISMRVEQSYIAQVKATKLAEKRSNHKRLFFANMSHDLRTPLAAIIGLIDLCLSHSERISVELEANMVQMKTCATTLLGILNSILDMSKAEVGKLELEVSDFDIVKVLEEAVDIFAVVGAKKGIEVVLELPDDTIEVVRWVRGDAERVKQLLCDLLSNGVKFTSQGFVILRAYPKHPSQSWMVSASRRSGRWFQKKFMSCCGTSGSSSNSNNVSSGNNNNIINNNSQISRLQSTDTLEFEFEVEDTGQGIPQSRREAVFRNFVQGSSKVHCTYGGTGLGLAIVRSLVHMMGGQIKVANKEGPGTLFKFNLHFEKPTREHVSSASGRGASQCWPLSGLQQSFGEESQLLENAAPVGGFAGHNLQVVLAMEGELGRSFVSGWMQKKGAQVCEVSQWQQIIPSLERVLTDRTSVCSDSSLDIESNGASRFRGRSIVCLAMLDTALIPERNPSIATKFRVDLDELIRSSRVAGRCVHISWIFSADTSNLVWQTLHSRSDLIIHKPVHGSRMVTLIEDLQAQHHQHVVAEQQQEPLVRARRSDYEGRRRSSASQNGNGVAQEPASKVSIRRTDTSDSLKNEAAAESGGDSQGSLAELRILVVEDTVLLQKVTKAMLEREGARVQVAENGEEAVKAVAETLSSSENPGRFDLLLMDCQMPVMDGYTATSRIRELEKQLQQTGGEDSQEDQAHRRVPIIALTAHAMASDEEKCREVGMDDYLTKPLKLGELTCAISKLGIVRDSKSD